MANVNSDQSGNLEENGNNEFSGDTAQNSGTLDTTQGGGQASNDNEGAANSPLGNLTPKSLTKMAALAAKTIVLTTSASKIEEEIRESIKAAKKGQLLASQRELEGEPTPEGEDVESWVKLVRKLKNKLDKHITANEALGKTLEQHAANFKALSEGFLELAKAYE
ncbi:hypothetical protein [Pseudomonas sp. R5(2019)]|uniref:hypothetical protein n=1 Tax=Pseudomonas sp. R5(2019) TaxID=2697566 RepID=UPI00141289DA|nr:hypothetical protein [Pseudomonas sp. R5(2019)]NBA95283.1 hypothetical protein [Pseudomonas sp. R5(2019)]